MPVNATATPLALLASFRIAPTSVSTSTSINFSAQAIGGITPYVFSWSFGDGTSASGPTSAHSYATPGNFTVTLIASDSSNQTASTSQVVDVHSAQQPPGGGGVCLLCSLGPLLPMLFILTIGIASGLSTVAAVFFARKRTRGRQEKVLARTYLRNGKTTQNYAT